MRRDNELRHVDAYLSPHGPKKYLTQEEKDSVHNEIDIKMEQMERLGMTREEILHDVPKGLKLKDDPFW